MSPARRPARIRDAVPGDLDELVEIEDAVFPGDRLTRRNFRHAVASPSIIALVAADDDGVGGYALVETRRGARVARLSSIAVAPGVAGTGLGGRLVEAAETAAASRGCNRLRLEVRADNLRAIALYERAGYQRTGRTRRYYEDGAAALRLEKSLARGREP
jgi:ribosomal-protein-alanine acetyltransferase